jgi:hypothetical protein
MTKTIIIIITTRSDTDMLRVIDDFMVEMQIVWNRGTIISAMKWRINKKLVPCIESTSSAVSMLQTG